MKSKPFIWKETGYGVRHDSIECHDWGRYLRSLKDGRTVWLDGEQVQDVTTHPAFTGNDW
jgi:hypothetical protein